MKRLPEIRLSRPSNPSDDFKWAGDDARGRPVGHRNKLGGVPDWLQQGYAAPSCPGCGELMPFFGQLDSVNDDVIIGDCGMIYVFFCFSCLQAATIVQC